MWHHHLNIVMSQLNERQRRWLAALEAERCGRGGETYIAEITGLDRKTIRRGRRELSENLTGVVLNRVRHVGAGRPRVAKGATKLKNQQANNGKSVDSLASG
ncbi:MAG: transposase [Chloroflexi bacterium]|nr:transposase [Chloroflexota bacterium]